MMTNEYLSTYQVQQRWHHKPTCCARQLDGLEELPKFELDGIEQGNLTEREGLVQLTSKLRLLVS
jgi:hypothetical protein